MEANRRLESEAMFIVVTEARLDEFRSTRFRPFLHRIGQVGNLVLFGNAGKAGKRGQASARSASNDVRGPLRTRAPLVE